MKDTNLETWTKLKFRPGPVRRFYKSKSNIDHRYDCKSVYENNWDQTVDDMTGERPCKRCKPSEKDEGPFCNLCGAYPAYGMDRYSPEILWICETCLTPELKLLLSLSQQIQKIGRRVHYLERRETDRESRRLELRYERR